MVSAMQSHLQALVERVEGGGSAFSGEASRSTTATGWPEVDRALNGGLVPGVHEWFGEDVAADIDRSGNGKQGDWRPPLAVLMHLAKQVRPTRQGAAGWVVWVGRRCWPHPHGLVGGLVREERLLARSLWVDPADRASRLWAIDLAARCGDVAVVMADGSGLDMAATRRLQLAAGAGDTLVLLARPPMEEKALSAARTRWRVTPTVSETPFPRWELALCRCKGGQRGAGREGPGRWLLEGVRSRGQGLVVVPATPGDRLSAAEAPTPRVASRRA